MRNAKFTSRSARFCKRALFAAVVAAGPRVFADSSFLSPGPGTSVYVPAGQSFSINFTLHADIPFAGFDLTLLASAANAFTVTAYSADAGSPATDPNGAFSLPYTLPSTSPTGQAPDWGFGTPSGQNAGAGTYPVETLTFSTPGGLSPGAYSLSALNSGGHVSEIYTATSSTFPLPLTSYPINVVSSSSEFWAQAQSGNWSTSSNWQQNAVPSSSLDTYFDTGSSSPYTVTLTSTSAAKSLTVAGDNMTLALAGNSLSVGGALTVDGSLALSGSGKVSVNSLSVGAGKLDLMSNGIVINYGNSASQAAVDAGVLSYLSGASYDEATQSGTSIISSSLTANTQYAIGEVDGNDHVTGSPVAANTLELAYTLKGDLNLDGIVNGTDFSILVTHFGQPITGIGWEQGDINGDGIVNGTDFSALVTNFGAPNNSAAFSENTGGGLVTVPEPAAGILVIGGISALIGRRRRPAQGTEA